MKRLKDITLDWDDDKYYHTGMHHSTLSRYINEGYEGIRKINEPLHSPALTFGSMVDVLITEGEDAFDRKFSIGCCGLSDKVKTIVETLYSSYGRIYRDFRSIPYDVVSNVAKECGYYSDNKFDKCRYDRLMAAAQSVDQYYQNLRSGKTVVDIDEASKAYACRDRLLVSETTKGYFSESKDESVEKVYQAVFAEEIDGILYAIKLDLVIVDHDMKTITLCDLKTTGSMEAVFAKSFVKFAYDIQARLYYRVIKKALEKDDYFKDFTVFSDFRFIVINKDSLDPLVFSFDADREGNIKIGYIRLRDPFDVAKEVDSYLKDEKKLPYDMSRDKANDIENILLAQSMKL